MLVERLIQEKAKAERQWPKSEMGDLVAKRNQLPPDGGMTHLDYTSYAHAMLVRRLIGQPKYVALYTDQDEVLRGAFTSAFASKILMDQFDMAYVQFQKMMEIDEKRAFSFRCVPSLRALELRCGCHKEMAISRKMARDYAMSCRMREDRRDRWIPHPKDTPNEPCGTVRYFVCKTVSRHWLTNLSPNMTANWVLASVHSRGGRFQSCAALVRNWPEQNRATFGLWTNRGAVFAL
jgi:hypothetical protein